jgi:hypothetical protein
MSRLCDLSVKYKSDKFEGGFTAFYDSILSHRSVRGVLEIGIGTPEIMQHVPDYKAGASLRMWEDYFPGAQIFGIDNQPAAIVNEGRIRSEVFDQTKRSELIAAAQWAGCNFDLIVDDGDHCPISQVLGVTTLMQYLNNDGLYIIEDVHRPNEVTEMLPFAHTVVQTFNAHSKRKGSLILVYKQ